MKTSINHLFRAAVEFEQPFALPFSINNMRSDNHTVNILCTCAFLSESSRLLYSWDLISVLNLKYLFLQLKTAEIYLNLRICETG